MVVVVVVAVNQPIFGTRVRKHTHCPDALFACACVAHVISICLCVSVGINVFTTPSRALCVSRVTLRVVDAIVRYPLHSGRFVSRP